MVAALPRVASPAAAPRRPTGTWRSSGSPTGPTRIADGLSTGERKRLELARALATRPRLLLLDEVTGGVDQRSLPGLVALIRRIRREGVALLVIEHNLRVISEIADRLVMMHLGEKVREGDPAAVVADPRVVDIYVGGASARRLEALEVALRRLPRRSRRVARGRARARWPASWAPTARGRARS